MLLSAHFRRPLTAALMLLVVVAMQHCAWEAAEVIRELQIVAAHHEAGRPLPVGLPVPGCDNESGCICRGATLAHGVEPVLFQPVPIDLLLVDGAAVQPGFFAVETADEVGNWADQFRPPPLSGRILRAHLSSLVI